MWKFQTAAIVGSNASILLNFSFPMKKESHTGFERLEQMMTELLFFWLNYLFVQCEEQQEEVI